ERALEAFLDELPQIFNRRYTREEEVNRYIARVNSDEVFRAKLRDRLDHGESGGARLLVRLYWGDDPRTRPPLLVVLRPAPTVPQRVPGRPLSLQGRRAARRLRGARPAGVPLRDDPARPRTLVQVPPLRHPPAQGASAPDGAGVVLGQDTLVPEAPVVARL